MLILQECSGPHSESDTVNSSINSQKQPFSAQGRAGVTIRCTFQIDFFYPATLWLFGIYCKLIFSHETCTSEFMIQHTHTHTHTHIVIFQFTYKISLQAIPTDCVCVCMHVQDCFFTVLILCSCNGLCSLIWRNSTYIIFIGNSITNYENSAVLNLN